MLGSTETGCKRFAKGTDKAALVEYLCCFASASSGLKNVCNLACFHVKSVITSKRNKLVPLEQLNVIMEFFSNDVAIPGK